MQKLSVFILFFLVFSSCREDVPQKKQSGFDTFNELHENDKGVITIGMPVFLFKMFVNTDNKEVESAFGKIKGIDFFIKEGASDELTKDLYTHLSSKTYTTFLTLNNENTKVKFLLKENGEKLDEVVIVIHEQIKNDCVILRIDGTFDIKNIEALADKIDISEIAKYR
ncbi:MAG: DUF4252 domain-containing protein [Bacteroidales bacterium]|nr:DUF4252 domain-containing protein [Bacteroidales bacterium]